VPQIREFAYGVWETSKFGGTGLISLFRVGVFTLFNCGPIKPTNISIGWMPKIGEFASGVWKTSKLGDTGFIWLFQVGVFT
jgi:hypothetical protein